MDSLGVIVPGLEETGLLPTDYGQTLRLSALIADVATMFLVTLFVTVHTTGSLVQLLVSLSVIPGSWLLYQSVRWIQRRPYARAWVGDEHARIRGVLAVLTAGCVFAGMSGSEPILGGFLAGTMVSALPFAMKPVVLQSTKGWATDFSSRCSSYTRAFTCLCSPWRIPV